MRRTTLSLSGYNYVYNKGVMNIVGSKTAFLIDK